MAPGWLVLAVWPGPPAAQTGSDALQSTYATPVYSVSNLLLIAVARQQSLFAVITDKARLHQNGRDIRRTQHAQASMFRATFMQRPHTVELA